MNRYKAIIARWRQGLLSKTLYLYHNTRSLKRYELRSCAPDVDPVGGEDSFLKNLTYLLYRRSAEGGDRDLRGCQIM